MTIVEAKTNLNTIASVSTVSDFENPLARFSGRSVNRPGSDDVAGAPSDREQTKRATPARKRSKSVALAAAAVLGVAALSAGITWLTFPPSRAATDPLTQAINGKVAQFFPAGQCGPHGNLGHNSAATASTAVTCHGEGFDASYLTFPSREAAEAALGTWYELLGSSYNMQLESYGDAALFSGANESIVRIWQGGRVVFVAQSQRLNPYQLSVTVERLGRL